MFDWLFAPWPWYVAGPLIGLTVPLFMWIDNKRLGISSVLRHICAATLPAKIPFFTYNWKNERWNLLFVFGICIGAFVATNFLTDATPFQIDAKLQSYLAAHHITQYPKGIPEDVFSWQSLFTLRGFVCMVLGGFLVGFGTRYAGGCTSGHAITGISQLQWPSLVATICFMVGGILATYCILPFIL